MPQVSRNKLKKSTERQLIDNLNMVLSSISKQEEMLQFLEAFLTETELLMLAKRFAVVILLSEKLSDTEIANTLHMTRITVAKMRYFMEARGKGFDIAFAKIAKEKNLQEFKRFLLSLTKYAIRAAGGYVKPGILD
ncbi:MAG: hypothetical protein HYV40_00050 [Candidatus Levybacteria bacterium]|nr:hypothetical protein [Candidatus Levybacteria bacterium]